MRLIIWRYDRVIFLNILDMANRNKGSLKWTSKRDVEVSVRSTQPAFVGSYVERAKENSQSLELEKTRG